MANTCASRVPEPALIRGAAVAVTSLIAVVTGTQIDLAWLEVVLNIYAVLAPVVAGFFIRSAVTPTETAEARVEEALYTPPPVAGGDPGVDGTPYDRS